jgi:hypothetical protein
MVQPCRGLAFDNAGVESGIAATPATADRSGVSTEMSVPARPSPVQACPIAFRAAEEVVAGRSRLWLVLLAQLHPVIVKSRP